MGRYFTLNEFDRGAAMILLDLDGVVADFVGGACAVHGRPDYHVTRWSWYDEWGQSDAEFWRPIALHGASFYQRFVKPYPWAQDLLRLIKDTDLPFIIATANPLHAGLVASKVDWIRDHVGHDVSVMMGDRKDLLSSPGRILIDDNDKNVSDFRGRGGEAIIFPQPWNACSLQTSERLEWVRLSLARYEKGTKNE